MVTNESWSIGGVIVAGVTHYTFVTQRPSIYQNIELVSGIGFNMPIKENAEIRGASYSLILARCVIITQDSLGPVLELGAGYDSTPLLKGLRPNRLLSNAHPMAFS